MVIHRLEGERTTGDNAIVFELDDFVEVILVQNGDVGQVTKDDGPTGLSELNFQTFVVRIDKNVDAVGGSAFSYFTAPSAAGPVPVVLPVGKRLYIGAVLGAALPPSAPITTSVEKVESEDNTLTITTDSAGNLVSAAATEGVVTRVSFEDLVLCVLKDDEEPEPTPCFVGGGGFCDPDGSNTGEYDCDSGFELGPGDRTSTKTGDNSICGYWYRGFYLRYTC